MNGATTEPCASTSRPPSTTEMTMIGSSQYLRRAPRNCHICITKSMGRNLSCLEHVAVAVVGRARRLARHPVARLAGLEAPAHRVAAEGAHQHGDRGEDGEEDDPEHHRRDDAAENLDRKSTRLNSS